MTTRGVRVVRGTLAASVAVFVAALFHAASGGGAPSTLAVTLSLAFSIPVCSVLAGRRLALWRLAASVCASQVVFHVLFGLRASHDTFAGVTGHVHPGSHLTLVAGAPPHMTMLPDSPPMWLGHLSAALITIVALSYGEAATRSLAHAAAIRAERLAGALGFGVAQRALTLRVPDVAPRLAARPRPILLPAVRIALGRLRHRGPPATLALR